MHPLTHSSRAYLLGAAILGLTLFAHGVLGTTSVSAEKPGSSLATCGATDVQFLGQSEALNDATVDGIPIVELSGITYDARSGRYYANSDRVSGSAQSRFFTLDIPLSAETLGTPSALSSTVLRKADGSPSTGSDFDAEGIALTHQGELLIASEGRAGAGGTALFQTEVRQYSLDGTLLASLPVPSRYLIPPAAGGQGVSNLVFESMALSPNGRSLFTANETPLSGDGVTADREGRIRIVRYEDRGPGGFVPVAEFFYLMEPARNPTGPLEVGVAEIIALSETDLLVLERGFVVGSGNTVRLFMVSLEGAEDISDEPSLAAAGLEPLEKTLLVDLVTCPSGGATLPPGATQPNALLDNFEAMTLGPRLPGGRRALILISDDNSATNQKTRVVALAIPNRDLVGN